MQWLEDPKQSNLDNLNNGKREANRHFSKYNKENMKGKIDETNSKIKNIRYLYRSVNDFKIGYQPRTNIGK
jgi:hypothetical protein